MSDGVNRGLPGTVAPLYFKYEEVASNLPAAPAEYPRNMQGILWLDQAGCYGSSNLPTDLVHADLCISFGDTAYDVLDEKTRTIYVSMKGPAWQFNNVPAAWETFENGFSYKVSFNEDYTRAQWESDHTIRNWKMAKQTPNTQKCPPNATASKNEKSKCATWIRETCKLNKTLEDCKEGHTAHYPVYEIVAPNGSKVQPYFDAYVACATEQATLRSQLDGTSFVGEYEGNTAVPVLTTLVMFVGVAVVGGLVASKFIPFGRAKDKPLITPGAE